MRDYEFVRFVSSFVKILVPLWSPHPNNLIYSYQLERPQTHEVREEVGAQMSEKTSKPWCFFGNK